MDTNTIELGTCFITCDDEHLEVERLQAVRDTDGWTTVVFFSSGESMPLDEVTMSIELGTFLFA